eukprot:3971814-Prymnesium_polylepis.1
MGGGAPHPLGGGGVSCHGLAALPERRVGRGGCGRGGSSRGDERSQRCAARHCWEASAARVCVT